MIGEFAHLVRMQEWLDPDDHEVWNQIAWGFTDQILDLSLGSNSESASFALVWGNEYFSAYPILQGGQISG